MRTWERANNIHRAFRVCDAPQQRLAALDATILSGYCEKSHLVWAITRGCSGFVQTTVPGILLFGKPGAHGYPNLQFCSGCFVVNCHGHHIGSVAVGPNKT